jgi:hypothetical protein
VQVDVKMEVQSELEMEDLVHYTPLKRVNIQSIQFEDQQERDQQDQVKFKVDSYRASLLTRNQPYMLQFPNKYHSQVLDGEPVRSCLKYPDGRVIQTYAHKTVVQLPSGAKREIYKDGYEIIYFENGDIRQSFPAYDLNPEGGLQVSDLKCGK